MSLNKTEQHELKKGTFMGEGNWQDGRDQRRLNCDFNQNASYVFMKVSSTNLINILSNLEDISVLVS